MKVELQVSKRGVIGQSGICPLEKSGHERKQRNSDKVQRKQH